MTLPQGWVETSVDFLGDFLNGMAFKPQDWGDDGIGIIRIQNLTNRSKPLNRTMKRFAERYRVRRGDLLVSWSATLDAYIWDRDDAVLNQHIFKVTPSKCVDKPFLFHILRDIIAELRESEHLHGSTMKHINRGPFLAHKVALPPLAEQRRIVAKLDALTNRLARARADLTRIPTLVENLRSSAVIEAFTGRLTNNLPVDLSNKAYSGSIEWRPDIEIPEHWRWAAVGEVVATSQYGSSSKTNDDASGVPVLRMGNIQNGRLEWDSLKFLPQTHPEFPSLLLSPGDVLFNRTNSFELVGKSAVYRGERAPASFASYLIRLRTTDILPELLATYLNSPFARRWIEKVASQQVGQANVNGTKLKGLGVPVPPAAEQREIVARLDAIFARAARMEAEAARALALLDRMEAEIMAKAFRGELVPQGPADEPASALLARVQAERAAAPKAKRGRRGKAAA